ncbi:MAG: DUF3817 domain-containing protein [Flavobacteriales bacterium]
MLKILKWIGFAEGLSFLVILWLTMPLKYLFLMPELNKPVGMAHGLLFVAYVFLVLMVGLQENWSKKAIFWSLLASLIPFGTFYADKLFFKNSEQN